MLVGPVFTREVFTVPRRTRFYVSRSVYVMALLLLMAAAYQVLFGAQTVRNVGDLAHFGAVMFQILAPLQLAMAVLFSALLTASAVAQEKDRKTLVLLLLSRLSNGELVLGKLLASLLNVLVLLAAALPLFLLTALLGGVSFQQIGRVFAVTLASALVAGSLGSTMALWREKTFQTLALTTLALVFWLAFWEIVAAGVLGAGWANLSSETWAVFFSPWQAIQEAARPVLVNEAESLRFGSPVHGFLLSAVAATVLLNGVAIVLVRVWNPSRELQPRDNESRSQESIWGVEHDLSQHDAAPDPETKHRSVHAAPGRVRRVWDNPIFWREVRTWAYGRKVLVIRLAYLVLFFASAAVVHGMTAGAAGVSPAALSLIPAVAKPLAPLFAVSLILLNALAVTSLTTERDGRALDLLLVTDLTPKEIIFGKLGGVLYNSKEMIVLPMLLCVYLWYGQGVSGENLVLLLGGLAVMNGFVAMLGIHSAMTYSNSRSAIGVSLGTLLFLFLGVATCMRLIIALSGSFQGQLQPFFALMLGGGIGLYLSLGYRNPSAAICLASFGAPFATFYAITSFIERMPLAVFLVTIITYGFATAAMLIPAIYEFDVATGRAVRNDE